MPDIEWKVPSAAEVEKFERELAAGLWAEVSPGQYAPSCGSVCGCFDPE